MIILTGGAGFIGSCLLKKLNDVGISDILVVDRLRSGPKWKNLVGKKFNDYVDKSVFREKIDDILKSHTIDAIFHLGACTDTTETDADYIIDNNFNYSKELAELALDRNARFIYASSAATYGNGEYGYSDTLFDDLKPLNPYGYSKHLFDQWCIARGYDKIFTGLKFFNVFGPNEYHKGSMASMIYKSYFQARFQGRIRLFKSSHPDYGDGEQQRDFVYVKDVVDVIMKIYDNKNIAGIYNLGSGTAHTWNDLANGVIKATGLEGNANIEYIEMPKELVNQYQNYTCADMVKTESALKHEFYKFEDAITDYVRNYLMKDWQNL
jgi:ADP-L-glycero-D-manno-heptose 6-epimerase